MGMPKLAVALILVLVLWCSSAHAQNTTSFVGSTGSTNVSNSAVNYFAISGIDGVATANSFLDPGNSTVTFVMNSTALSWTFKNFWCFSGTSPGTGKSYTMEIVDRIGTAFANKVVISDSATSGSDTTNTQNTSTWGMSTVAMRVTPSGTPTATTISCYIEANIN
jgi:hypothetical protein